MNFWGWVLMGIVMFMGWMVADPTGVMQFVNQFEPNNDFTIDKWGTAKCMESACGDTFRTISGPVIDR